MKDISQIDLGATILSITIAGGFVAFGFLVLRILMAGITKVLKKFGKKGLGDIKQ